MLRLALLIAAAGLLFTPPGAAVERSLYERIGGAPVLQHVTEQMLARVAGDPALNQSFDGVDIAKLSVKLAAHLCALTGGGCATTSDSVKVVHAGLNIDEREFYAIVESLRTALDDNGVGEREKNELLRMLAPFKRDIVTR